MLKRSKDKKIREIDEKCPVSTTESEKEKEENILTKSILEWNKPNSNSSVANLVNSAVMLNEKDIEPYKDMSDAKPKENNQNSNEKKKQKTLYNPYSNLKDKTLKNGDKNDNYENNERD